MQLESQKKTRKRMGKENIWRNNGQIFKKFDEMHTFTDPETLNFKQD